MSPLIKNNEHFIGTFFYWMPSMIVLIFSREITEYLFVDLSSIIMFFVFLFFILRYIYLFLEGFIRNVVQLFLLKFFLFLLFIVRWYCGATTQKLVFLRIWHFFLILKKIM